MRSSEFNIAIPTITPLHVQHENLPIQPSPLTEYRGNENSEDAFKVFIRIRPLNQRETTKQNPKKPTHIIKAQDSMVFVVDPLTYGPENYYRREKSYVFDNVFTETDYTQKVFQQSMLPLLDNVLNGYNATLFAYGMTGAGKTHTLFGELNPNKLEENNAGIILLTLHELFLKTQSTSYSDYEFNIRLSYLEIYNEQVRDLLKNDSQNLMIVEDPVRGVFVADLLEQPVSNIDEVMHVIIAGNSRRTMAPTAANQFSSRSHAIIQVLIERKNRLKDIKENIYQSKLSLIDLAGSERAAVTENKGLRLQEGANINKSLLSLGNCINILSDSTKKGAFVPYRDSKLTRLLKDSLGGNTKTTMIACVSPSSICYEETVNTLKYASRAKNIKRKVVQNTKEVELHVSQYKEIIQGLKSEIENLKCQLKTRSPHTRRFSISEPLYPQESESPEKQIEETSNKIFVNLEENWEISQTLKELNQLEAANRETLKTLLERIPQSEAQRVEIQSQIELLKQTMLNNERIKKEVEFSLKSNLNENKDLKSELLDFVQIVESQQDIDLARKFLDIEKLDLGAQNHEIKREALHLAKDRIAKEKQISEMENELRMMRLQLREKDLQIASNHEVINNLKSKVNEKAFSTPSNTEIKSPSLPQMLSPTPEVDPTTRTSSRLKALLSNLEAKVAQSISEVDEKVVQSSRNGLSILQSRDSIQFQTPNQNVQLSQALPTIPENYLKPPLNPERLQPSSEKPPLKESLTTITSLTEQTDLKSARYNNDPYYDSALVTQRTNQDHYQNDPENLTTGGDTYRAITEPPKQMNTYRADNEFNFDENEFNSQHANYFSQQVAMPSSRQTSKDEPIYTKILEKYQSLGNKNNPLKPSRKPQNEDRPLQISNAYNKKSEPTNRKPSLNLKINDLIEIEHQIEKMRLISEAPSTQSQRGVSISKQTPVNNASTTPENDKFKASKSFMGVVETQNTNSNYFSAANYNSNVTASNSRCSPFLTKDSDDQNSRPATSLGLRDYQGIGQNFYAESSKNCDNVSQDKRMMDIKSLGQEREALKIFRSKLAQLSNLMYKPLLGQAYDDARNLLDEYNQKKYIISTNDQAVLIRLQQLLEKSHENKENNRALVNRDRSPTPTGNYSTSKNRSASAARNSSSSKYGNNSAKNTARGQTPVGKPQKRNDAVHRSTDNNSKKIVKPVMTSQGSLSSISYNYAKTVNKVAPNAFFNQLHKMQIGQQNQASREVLKDKTNVPEGKRSLMDVFTKIEPFMK